MIGKSVLSCGKPVLIALRNGAILIQKGKVGSLQSTSDLFLLVNLNKKI
jgi:hypothetical protein